MAIDASSGAVVSSTELGSGDGDNTLQMVGTLGPTGVLYQGRYRGLFSVTAAVSSDCEPTCIEADFVADGVIDGNDLSFLLSYWGQAGEAEVADLNRDGIVNGEDLLLVLGFWGDCSP